jgi:RNA polymerase sigma-70 factor (ECF subfamily)
MSVILAQLLSGLQFPTFVLNSEIGMDEPSMNETENQSLWQRFTEGDTRVFDALIKQHYADLFGYGLKFSKDKSLLKDVVHDAFVALWHNRRLLNPEKNPKYYLLTIFRNRLLKSLKTPYLLDETSFEALTEEPIETHLIHAEDAAKVHLLIQKLPIRHQEALHLRFFEGLDNEQIADLMQVSKQSVANLIYSGLKRLRELWVLCLLVLPPSV